MKKLIQLVLVFLLLFVIGITATAEEGTSQTTNISLRLLDIKSYSDYQEIFGTIEKMAGVNDLVESGAQSGSILLTGKFLGDPNMFVNDVLAFTIDRYKADKKISADSVEITLKKL